MRRDDIAEDLLFAFRSSLALHWTRSYGEPPLMDLPTLLAKSIVPDEVRKTIVELG
jgi:hypothetical protein